MVSGFSSFLSTRRGKEITIGTIVIAAFLCWLFWDAIRLTWQFQQAPIAGLEQEATMGYAHDSAKGEALYREAAALENGEWPYGPSQENLIRARALFLDAVRHGYAPAVGRLGMSYLNMAAGPYLPVDAIKLFNRGVELNDTNSMRGLGLVYGKGIPGVIGKDEDQALTLFVRGAEQGDVEAQYLAGVYYLGQNEILFSGDFSIHPYQKVDEKKGLEWMSKAIANGSTKPYKALIWFFKYHKKNIQQAEYYAREGAMKGNRSCMFDLHMGYLGSGLTYGNDPERAACYERLYDSMPKDREVPIPNLDELCPPTRKGP